MAEEKVASKAIQKYREILTNIEIDENEVLEIIYALGSKKQYE